MENESFHFTDGKVVIRLRDRVCDTPEELLSSQLFYRVLYRCIADLSRKDSHLLGIFGHANVSEQDIRLLIETVRYLAILPAEQVIKLVAGSEPFFKDRELLNAFVEYVYNYWRSLQRLIVCDSVGSRFDKRPYRTFNNTVETLTHVVRSTYRDVQENITGAHPRIYRQVRAGAEIATIALTRNMRLPGDLYHKLSPIPVVRQVLIYPPLIFNPPMNKRKGAFVKVNQHPLATADLNRDEWLCYPAKVGPLLILVYFNLRFFELGFSMCNLFELAGDEEIRRKPDAIFLYGMPDEAMAHFGKEQTVFYEDNDVDVLVGAIPVRDEFGYFGYVKKMVLTLHNIRMMKDGRMPFHGALVNLTIRGKGSCTVLVMGDTGAGKSETLEALRLIGGDDLEDTTIIADDMGSLEIGPDGRVYGYGTETGAFVRLDDLQTGYAFGQIDRTIIMSPDQVNARVVLPVTTYQNIIRGYPIDFVLYANNYEAVDDEHPTLETFSDINQALDVFRAGKVMSKGTTTTTGMVQTFYANVFGPMQYPEMYEKLTCSTFARFFANGTYVGQMRTQLGISGMERTGPEASAKALLAAISERAHPKEHTLPVTRAHLEPGLETD
ncbi:MAG TPA: hypothetical protein VGJ97_13095 [Anaerolineaceae bacterium]|jgi:hypothetical protein